MNVLKNDPGEMIPWDGLPAYFVASGWFFFTIQYFKTKPSSLGWRRIGDFCNPAKIISTSGVLRWLNILGALTQTQWQYSQTWLADVKVQHKAAIKSYDSFTEQTGHHDRVHITTVLCAITSERHPLTVITVTLFPH